MGLGREGFEIWGFHEDWTLVDASLARECSHCHRSQIYPTSFLAAIMKKYSLCRAFTSLVSMIHYIHVPENGDAVFL